MTGYTILAGALIFFFLFIYAVWFGISIKIENQKEEDNNSSIKINPYDNIPLSRRFIDKKNVFSDDKLIFLKAISNVVKSGMNIVGVNTPDKM